MCFSLGTVEHLLVWIVVIWAAFLVVRVLLGLVAPAAGEFAWAVSAAIQVVRIVLGAIIAIAVIYVLFALLACAVPLR
jgi:hypothetical protein